MPPDPLVNVVCVTGYSTAQPQGAAPCGGNVGPNDKCFHFEAWGYHWAQNGVQEGFSKMYVMNMFMTGATCSSGGYFCNTPSSGHLTKDWIVTSAWNHSNCVKNEARTTDTFGVSVDVTDDDWCAW